MHSPRLHGGGVETTKPVGQETENQQVQIHAASVVLHSGVRHEPLQSILGSGIGEVDASRARYVG